MRATVLLLMLALLCTCAGEMERPADSFAAASETWTWPDITPIPDSVPWTAPDSYAGSPFGCEQDRDCFGLRCCRTPWGVKLCAATCP